MSILAGFKLKNINPWLSNYMKNPNLSNEANLRPQTNHYVIRRSNNPVAKILNSDNDSDLESDDRYVILKTTDDIVESRLNDYYSNKNKPADKNNNSTSVLH